MRECGEYSYKRVSVKPASERPAGGRRLDRGEDLRRLAKPMHELGIRDGWPNCVRELIYAIKSKRTPADRRGVAGA